MKKTLLLLIVLLVVLGIISFYRNNRNPLSHINNYRVFYGRPQAFYKKDFKAYDLLILEPYFYTAKNLRDLKTDNNQLLFGYLTVFEVSHWDKTLVDLMHPEDYLKIDGQRYQKEGISNFIGDIRSERYRNLLIQLIKERIVDKGFDGVFLDTVDWIDYFGYQDETLMKAFAENYKSFLIEIEERYPDLLMIQNRSFKSYKSFSKKYVDGIMWENFKYDEMFNEDLDITIDLVKNKLINGKQVLTVSHDDYKENKLWSQRMSWVFMPSYNSYSNWPNTTRDD